MYFRVMTLRVLDKTLFHRLESFKALWTVCSLTWKCLLDLEPFGAQWSPLYGEKCWMFIKILNLFSTEERKTWTSWMTWGWVNYQQKCFQKWTIVTFKLNRRDFDRIGVFGYCYSFSSPDPFHVLPYSLCFGLF